jgi:hypothetical protein
MSETMVSAKALPKYPPLRESLDLLTVAKLLGEGPGKWTKGAKYRNASGKPLDISDPQETPASFDITGAIDFVYRNQEQNQTARIRVGMELKTTATMWNDAPMREYGEVMDLVKRCNI